jgi:hypothetical protein
LSRTIRIAVGEVARDRIARRMFDLYASGQHSLNSVRILKTEFGIGIAKGYLERLPKNPFYKRQFIWEDKLYSGTHTPLVSAEQFEQVQRTQQTQILEARLCLFGITPAPTTIVR